MSEINEITLCWFRRDLRLHDQAALYLALKNSRQVHCVFVFDTDILDALPDKADRRVQFIWHSVLELKQALEALGSTLHILHGSAPQRVPQLAGQLGVSGVYCNHDYAPDAITRDAAVAQQLALQHIAFHTCKDQVIFERDEVLNGSGKPYAVFTPYKNAWLKKIDDFYLRTYPTERYFDRLIPCAPSVMPELETLGFQPTPLHQPAKPYGISGAEKLFDDFAGRIDCYQQTRDFPAMNGVSYLSPHLRFGTISIRTLARFAYYHGGKGAETWLSELIWRDFYQMLLWHHPQVVSHAYKPQFDHLGWENDPQKFAAWCAGRTGYPLVDAAMRQLNQTGLMHNRLRMVTASFLVKDLQIDWRWGERYFAQKLLDYDLASNNGGWQWAASTGCDAQPWFRIFNPVTQSERFDPSGKFIRRYVPELVNCPDKYIHAPWLLMHREQIQRGIVVGREYPTPIIDHAVARGKTLAMFKQAVG